LLADALLERLRAALFGVDFSTRQQPDWVCLDCELMAWSFKASAPIRERHAPVRVAGRARTQFALEELRAADALGAPSGRAQETDAAASRRRVVLPQVLRALRLESDHV